MNEFEKYRIAILKNRISFSFMKTAIPFYLGASLIDWIYVPGLWAEFLAVRIASCICFAALGFAISRQHIRRLKSVRNASYLVTLILGIGLGYMTYRTGGLESPYYAGLNWVGIGVLAFWPGRAKDRFMWTGTTYLPVFFITLLASDFSITRLSLLSIIFMVGTILLSTISNVFTMTSMRLEYQLRAQLEELIRDKDKIIERKSNETANLKRLAKQFSPAVIQAIESRLISLDQRKRQKVAIIFLDIVDSTQRSNSLDHGDYQRALDLFFDVAIKTLLSRNITVANFMGDGLMAIANAPFPSANFEKAAFEAATQIIEETRKRQRSFKELWRNELQVRVGISSGYANVGFFPNTDFGIYTALGDSVNLAARLCAVAPAFSIATTKEIIVAANDSTSGFTVKQAGTIGTLKGFAGYEADYYCATPKPTENNVEKNELCPLCGGSVVQATDLGDCIVIKCTKCQFTDIQNKKAAA